MKKLMIFGGLFLLGLSVFGQSIESQGFVFGRDTKGQAEAEAQRKQEAQWQSEKYAREFVPMDPWRVIQGRTNYAKGSNWVLFVGQLTYVSPSGPIFEGGYGPLMGPQEKMSFCVTNFPYKMAVGTKILGKDKFCAWKAGIYDNGGIPVHLLDYGQVTATPSAPLAHKPTTNQTVGAAVANPPPKPGQSASKN